MYEVHPDDKGQWLLYQTGDGGFDLIGIFGERADAEFACEVFEKKAPAHADGGDEKSIATAIPA